MTSTHKLEKKKILVAGAGAIGGITGGYLSNSGAEVVLYDKSKEHVKKINEKGLRVNGCRGGIRFYLEAIDNLKALPGKPDYVFVGVKSKYTKPLMKELKSYLKKKSIIISLQNGINEYVISKYVGKEKVFGVVTGWGATNKGPGMLTQTSKGSFILGSLSGKKTNQLLMVKELLEYCAPTKVSSNIMGVKYSKLMLNGIINTLGAITGVKLGRFILDKRGAIAFIKLWNEEAKILKSINIRPEPFEPFLNERTFTVRNDFEFHFALGVLYFIKLKAGDLTSSMLQDIMRGVRSENRYLLGHFIEINKKNIPLPFIRKAFTMVEEIEDRKRKIGMKNLDKLLSAGRINPRWEKLYKRSIFKLSDS